jgi:hypothetical protein
MADPRVLAVPCPQCHQPVEVEASIVEAEDGEYLEWSRVKVAPSVGAFGHVARNFTTDRPGCDCTWTPEEREMIERAIEAAYGVGEADEPGVTT